ncbi:hypothetical protein D9619_000047 [Psilocybe cf. subviscida]|uniref:Uncharacterized protein n=1 Tax=Psilocybe cf. subviscida TaxID=2480587 RepID=A0A8H5BHB5_9AGAR|nr:hypothetical protein D9619_000047 [Psilocybe cf. subviscida]
MASMTRPTVNIPNELYREIAKNLHQRRDKASLLSLALVSSVWRHESQRVLFSSLSNDWNSKKSTRRTHILFLESILAHPDRLGPCVHLYAQNGLAENTVAVEEFEEENFCEGMQLWDLTSRALSVMINLKHLYIYTGVNARSVAKDFLVDCRFQLETFSWRCEETSKEALVAFLLTQRVLTHIEIGAPAEWSDLSWLTPDMCPSLTSTVCRMLSAGLLEPRREVVALKGIVTEDIEHLLGLQNTLSSVFQRIRYLSVWSYPFSSTLLRPIAPNLSLLEIQIWDFTSSKSLFALNFPSLRVLALLDGAHIIENATLLVQIPTAAFDQLPKLEHIFIRPYNPVQFGYHAKMSLDRANPDAKVEVDRFIRDCRLGLPWWTVYEMDM